MKEKIKKLAQFLPAFVPEAHALTPGYPTIRIPTPIGGIKGTLGDWINLLINWAVALGAIVTIAYIVWGGFDYVTAGDDAKKVEAARAKITNGVIGLIIIASAWVIFRLLVSILNLGQVFPA
ncbi:MAG: hypothetical protein FJ044_00250 [Candidatus Cloacimonetes bacterium]|nr:hypothetical protein [Candidatus Cloacimonadota bacterium]